MLRKPALQLPRHRRSWRHRGRQRVRGDPYVISSAANPTRSRPTTPPRWTPPSPAPARPPIRTSSARTSSSTPPRRAEVATWRTLVPDGLYVECTDARGCLSGGDGIAYDPATGEIDARLSTDAGNVVSFGTDGGLFAPPPGRRRWRPRLADGRPDCLRHRHGRRPLRGDRRGRSRPGSARRRHQPPGGRPHGLQLECDDVRGCFTATGPATTTRPPARSAWKSAPTRGTRRSSARTAGSSPRPGLRPLCQAGDTNSVDTTVNGSGTAAVTVRREGRRHRGPGVERPGEGRQWPCRRSVCRRRQPAGVRCGRQAVRASGPAAGDRLWPPGRGHRGLPSGGFPDRRQPGVDDRLELRPGGELDAALRPVRGALWTPPEHTSAAVTVQQNHSDRHADGQCGDRLRAGRPVAWAEATYTADSLTTCRGCRTR